MNAKRNRLVFVLSAAAALAAPAMGQETTPCPALREMVERAVPASVGNAEAMGRLLSPAVGPQLSRRFRPRKVEAFAADALRPGEGCGARRGTPARDCEYANAEGSSLRIGLGRGRVVYTNLLRSEALVPSQLTPGAALEAARRAAEAFGVPGAEIANPAPRVRQVLVSTRPVEGAGGESFLAESHVWFKRAIGGVPVAYSKFHAALDASGRLARAHVRWPDFVLERGLSVAGMLSRREVTDNVIRELEGALVCGNLAGLTAETVYLASELLDGSDGPDAELGGPDTAPHAFVPALLVRVLPLEQAEDSGVVQEPVQEIAFALFAGQDN